MRFLYFVSFLVFHQIAHAAPAIFVPSNTPDSIQLETLISQQTGLTIAEENPLDVLADHFNIPLEKHGISAVVLVRDFRPVAGVCTIKESSLGTRVLVLSTGLTSIVTSDAELGAIIRFTLHSNPVANAADLAGNLKLQAKQLDDILISETSALPILVTLMPFLNNDGSAIF